MKNIKKGESLEGIGTQGMEARALRTPGDRDTWRERNAEKGTRGGRDSRWEQSLRDKEKGEGGRKGNQGGQGNGKKGHEKTRTREMEIKKKKKERPRKRTEGKYIKKL